MAHLFEPFTQKSVTLRNRIVMSPMCMYVAGDRRHAPPTGTSSTTAPGRRAGSA